MGVCRSEEEGHRKATEPGEPDDYLLPAFYREYRSRALLDWNLFMILRGAPTFLHNYFSMTLPWQDYPPVHQEML